MSCDNDWKSVQANLILTRPTVAKSKVKGAHGNLISQGVEYSITTFSRLDVDDLRKCLQTVSRRTVGPEEDEPHIMGISRPRF
ncbi:hypothetical protein E4U57_007908 [Claviceps arundinis]|uniref:Uncharacterized protein n=1 Tax=Claviceps arundinis TaxID=1623583 RepID=A0ABQ7PE52_9HYPO|nr:hypothetical protein E4U57_007908 [Claviceps arundinis]